MAEPNVGSKVKHLFFIENPLSVRDYILPEKELRTHGTPFYGFNAVVIDHGVK